MQKKQRQTARDRRANRPVAATSPRGGHARTGVGSKAAQAATSGTSGPSRAPPRKLSPSQLAKRGRTSLTADRARERWRDEARTLVELLYDRLRSGALTGCSRTLGDIEHDLGIGQGIIKMMRHKPTRHLSLANTRSVVRNLGLPWIAAAYPHEPIGKLVQFEDLALSDPLVEQ